jgi:catechol 2,3-dioxygenase-like lactoylglutathione lyase family enzyme
MLMKNYDNLFLPAENFEESKKFYPEILGLETKFEFAAWYWRQFRL